MRWHRKQEAIFNWKQHHGQTAYGLSRPYGLSLPNWTHVVPQSGLHAHVDGLLAGAEVAETTDGLLLVQVGGGRLHPSDGHHLMVVLQAQKTMVKGHLHCLETILSQNNEQGSGPFSLNQILTYTDKL